MCHIVSLYNQGMYRYDKTLEHMFVTLCHLISYLYRGNNWFKNKRYRYFLQSVRHQLQCIAVLEKFLAKNNY